MKPKGLSSAISSPSMINADVQKNLPDVAGDKVQGHVLSAVGMSGIEVPVRYQSREQGLMTFAARADAYVSLDQPEARGIHMSRLFSALQAELGEKALSLTLIRNLLEGFLRSHQGLSEHAQVNVRFPLLVQRTSLKSDLRGWRSYPAGISGEISGGKLRLFLEFQVLYSSTCPASAALSRSLIQDNFKENFKQKDLDFKQVYDWLGTPQGIVATPHAQRSLGRVRLELREAKEFFIEDYIDLAEEILATPVQTMVKRADEQEFALRNGQNLMFCEDAARRLAGQFDGDQRVLGYLFEVRHLESLHPHDAVAVAAKGSVGTFQIGLES